LALNRRIRKIVGDTASVVADLALCLRCCAAVYRDQGQRAEARTLLIEAIELLRGLQARGEMSPRISTALAGLSRDEGSLAGP